MLGKLGAKEESKLEIVNEALDKSVTVTLFADSMVEEGYIRLSEEDLQSLGMSDGDTVIIRKKPPLTEEMRERAGEMRERAGETVERVSEEIEKAGESVRKETEKARAGAARAADTVRERAGKAYGRIVEETAPITERVESATKETVEKIKKEVGPTTEKAEDTAREVYKRIVDELPGIRERLSDAAKPVMNRLKPDEGTKLKKALEDVEGSIRTVTVQSDTAADKLVKELELPKDVVISAVQRNKEIIIPKGDTRLVKGDIVYLVGKEESIQECCKILEG
jgi:K+/H+ antiporter YhaU regulatory subunit KhtT